MVTVYDKTVTITLTARNCPCCGCVFGISDRWEKQLREEGGDFYCPNGHKLHFPKDMEVERLKKQLAEQEAIARRRLQALEYERRSHAATKGQMTKLKNRVGAGVCPCCSRTFQNLQRHMGNKHPDFRREEL